MALTPKETSLLKDLRSQEQLCVEKYGKYAADACDAQLKDLFTQIGQTETQHLQTLDQISSGIIPQVGGAAQQQQPPVFSMSTCPPADKQKDAYLCVDALSTEKHVSAEYNTCVFEFADTNIRNVLNHIQKEEQEHGEQIYSYMSQNGMYN